MTVGDPEVKPSGPAEHIDRQATVPLRVGTSAGLPVRTLVRRALSAYQWRQKRRALVRRDPFLYK